MFWVFGSARLLPHLWVLAPAGVRGQFCGCPCGPGGFADEVSVGELGDDARAGARAVVVHGYVITPRERLSDETPQSVVSLADLVFGHIVSAGSHPVAHTLDR